MISNPFGALYSPDLDWLSQVNQASFQRNGYVVDYTLDLVGNRVEQVRKQSTYTAYRNTSETVSYERTTSQFDARDRLFEEVGESRPTTTAAWSPLFDVDYVYDANGSLESKTRTGTAPETTTYEFDVRNRLAGTERNRTVTVGPATQPEELVGQYVYDDAGIRTRVRETTATGTGASASVKTTITDYLLDHQNPTGYAQAIEERMTSATGTVAAPPNVSPPLVSALPTVSYVFGHEIITQARAGASATSQPRTAIYRHDAHSGVRQLVGTSTAQPLTTFVYDNYTYEAYGTLLPNGPQVTNRGTINTHLYRGEVWDAGLGMTYLRARYVDHKTGRFVGMDPWEGSPQNPLTFHDFVYAHNDPLGMVDPSGEGAFFLYGVVERLFRNAGRLFTGSGAGRQGFTATESEIEVSPLLDIGQEFTDRNGTTFGRQARLTLRISGATSINNYSTAGLSKAFQQAYVDLLNAYYILDKYDGALQQNFGDAGTAFGLALKDSERRALYRNRLRDILETAEGGSAPFDIIVDAAVPPDRTEECTAYTPWKDFWFYAYASGEPVHLTPRFFDPGYTRQSRDLRHEIGRFFFSLDDRVPQDDYDIRTWDEIIDYLSSESGYLYISNKQLGTR